VGARVGRSIALSSSQTQGHNITQGSLNQGAVVSWEASKRPASNRSSRPPSRRNGDAVAARTRPLNNCRANVASTIHSSSFRVRMTATTSKSGTSRSSSASTPKTSGRRFLILLHHKHVCPGAGLLHLMTPMASSCSLSIEATRCTAEQTSPGV
jgi:hypothetical protein